MVCASMLEDLSTSLSIRESPHSFVESLVQMPGERAMAFDIDLTRFFNFVSGQKKT